MSKMYYTFDNNSLVVHDFITQLKDIEINFDFAIIKIVRFDQDHIIGVGKSANLFILDIKTSDVKLRHKFDVDITEDIVDVVSSGIGEWMLTTRSGIFFMRISK